MMAMRPVETDVSQADSHLPLRQVALSHGIIHYTEDNGIKPDYYFYEPEPNTQLNPPGTDHRSMTIRNGWPQVSRFSLDQQGFELHPFLTDEQLLHTQPFTAFDDDGQLKKVFDEQVQNFVKRHTGASRVVVFDRTVRKRMLADLKVQTTTYRPAVMLAHSDYTPKSGPQRVRDVVPDEADKLLSGRVAFFNVWKPLYQRVDELPLAMCDARTQADGDLLLMDLKYRERTGEIYVLRHNPAHDWYYFPQMLPNDALLLKTYDSETDGRARFMGHTAFEDPLTPPEAPKRESIEVRTMAFFSG